MNVSTFCREIWPSLQKWSHCWRQHTCHAGLWRSWCMKGRTAPSSTQCNAKYRSHHLVLNWHIPTQQNKTISQATPTNLWTQSTFFLLANCCVHVMIVAFASVLHVCYSYSAPQLHSATSLQAVSDSRRSPQHTHYCQSKLHYASLSFLLAKEQTNKEHRDKAISLALSSSPSWTEKGSRKHILFHVSGMWE